MPHLHDMEELVNSIQDNEVKDYMKEAMSCYMASAYRACIVLTYIALFHDIVKKLGELGKVNKKARAIHENAQKKINDQNIYESYLIDQLKSNSLLPALDTSFLETLRTLRNKSSHPSGHHPSAEEARFIFFEATNRFLSKPILTTTQLVDYILSRLDEKHFFPSTDISKISAVVKKELLNIHHEALPYLINKFLEKTQSTNSDTSKNAGFFLTGLTYLKEENYKPCLRKHIIEAKSSDSNFSKNILQTISADGELLRDLDLVTYDRLRIIISERISSVEPSLEPTRFSHPASVIRSILKEGGEDLVIEQFENQLRELFGKSIFIDYFIAQMEDSQRVIDIYHEKACEKAGSSTFDTANYFSRNLGEVDAPLAKLFSDKQSFVLLVNILKAADIGSWGAKSLRRSKFSTVPELKEKAKRFLSENEDETKTVYQDVVYATDEDFEEKMAAYLSDEDSE